MEKLEGRCFFADMCKYLCFCKSYYCFAAYTGNFCLCIFFVNNFCSLSKVYRGEKKRENVFLHTVIFLILDVVEVLFYALLFTNYSCCCQNVLYVFVLPWNSFTSAYFGLPFWYICPVIIQYVL